MAPPRPEDASHARLLSAASSLSAPHGFPPRADITERFHAAAARMFSVDERIHGEADVFTGVLPDIGVAGKRAGPSEEEIAEDEEEDWDAQIAEEEEAAAFAAPFPGTTVALGLAQQQGGGAEGEYATAAESPTDDALGSPSARRAPQHQAAMLAALRQLLAGVEAGQHGAGGASSLPGSATGTGGGGSTALGGGGSRGEARERSLLEVLHMPLADDDDALLPAQLHPLPKPPLPLGGPGRSGAAAAVLYELEALPGDASLARGGHGAGRGGGNAVTSSSASVPGPSMTSSRGDEAEAPCAGPPLRPSHGRTRSMLAVPPSSRAAGAAIDGAVANSAAGGGAPGGMSGVGASGGGSAFRSPSGASAGKPADVEPALPGPHSSGASFVTWLAKLPGSLGVRADCEASQSAPGRTQRLEISAEFTPQDSSGENAASLDQQPTVSVTSTPYRAAGNGAQPASQASSRAPRYRDGNMTVTAEPLVRGSSGPDGAVGSSPRLLPFPHSSRITSKRDEPGAADSEAARQPIHPALDILAGSVAFLQREPRTGLFTPGVRLAPSTECVIPHDGAHCSVDGEALSAAATEVRLAREAMALLMDDFRSRCDAHDPEAQLKAAHTLEVSAAPGTPGDEFESLPASTSRPALLRECVPAAAPAITALLEQALAGIPPLSRAWAIAHSVAVSSLSSAGFIPEALQVAACFHSELADAATAWASHVLSGTHGVIPSGFTALIPSQGVVEAALSMASKVGEAVAHVSAPPGTPATPVSCASIVIDAALSQLAVLSSVIGAVSSSVTMHPPVELREHTPDVTQALSGLPLASARALVLANQLEAHKQLLAFAADVAPAASVRPDASLGASLPPSFGALPARKTQRQLATVARPFAELHCAAKALLKQQLHVHGRSVACLLQGESSYESAPAPLSGAIPRSPCLSGGLISALHWLCLETAASTELALSGCSPLTCAQVVDRTTSVCGHLGLQHGASGRTDAGTATPAPGVRHRANLSTASVASAAALPPDSITSALSAQPVPPSPPGIAPVSPPAGIQSLDPAGSGAGVGEGRRASAAALSSLPGLHALLDRLASEGGSAMECKPLFLPAEGGPLQGLLSPAASALPVHQVAARPRMHHAPMRSESAPLALTLSGAGPDETPLPAVFPLHSHRLVASEPISASQLEALLEEERQLEAGESLLLSSRSAAAGMGSVGITAPSPMASTLSSSARVDLDEASGGYTSRGKTDEDTETPESAGNAPHFNTTTARAHRLRGHMRDMSGISAVSAAPTDASLPSVDRASDDDALLARVSSVDAGEAFDEPICLSAAGPDVPCGTSATGIAGPSSEAGPSITASAASGPLVHILSPTELLHDPAVRLRSFAKLLSNPQRFTAPSAGFGAALPMCAGDEHQAAASLAKLASAYAASAGVLQWPYARAALMAHPAGASAVRDAPAPHLPPECEASGVLLFARRSANMTVSRALYAFALCWAHASPSLLSASGSAAAATAAATGTTRASGPSTGQSAVAFGRGHARTHSKLGTAPVMTGGGEYHGESLRHVLTLSPTTSSLVPALASSGESSSTSEAPAVLQPAAGGGLMQGSMDRLRQLGDSRLVTRVRQLARSASTSSAAGLGMGQAMGPVPEHGPPCYLRMHSRVRITLPGADDSDQTPPIRALPPPSQSQGPAPAPPMTSGSWGTQGSSTGLPAHRTLASELQTLLKCRYPSESALYDCVRVLSATPAEPFAFRGPPGVLSLVEATGSGVEQLLLRTGMLSISNADGRLFPSPGAQAGSDATQTPVSACDLTSARGLLSALASLHLLMSGSSGGVGGGTGTAGGGTASEGPSAFTSPSWGGRSSQPLSASGTSPPVALPAVAATPWYPSHPTHTGYQGAATPLTTMLLPASLSGLPVPVPCHLVLEAQPAMAVSTEGPSRELSALVVAEIGWLAGYRLQREMRTLGKDALSTLALEAHTTGVTLRDHALLATASLAPGAASKPSGSVPAGPPVALRLGVSSGDSDSTSGAIIITDGPTAQVLTAFQLASPLALVPTSASVGQLGASLAAAVQRMSHAAGVTGSAPQQATAAGPVRDEETLSVVQRDSGSRPWELSVPAARQHATWCARLDRLHRKLAVACLRAGLKDRAVQYHRICLAYSLSAGRFREAVILADTLATLQTDLGRLAHAQATLALMVHHLRRHFEALAAATAGMVAAPDSLAAAATAGQIIGVEGGPAIALPSVPAGALPTANASQTTVTSHTAAGAMPQPVPASLDMVAGAPTPASAAGTEGLLMPVAAAVQVTNMGYCMPGGRPWRKLRPLVAPVRIAWSIATAVPLGALRQLQRVTQRKQQAGLPMVTVANWGAWQLQGVTGRHGGSAAIQAQGSGRGLRDHAPRITPSAPAASSARARHASALLSGVTLLAAHPPQSASGGSAFDVLAEALLYAQLGADGATNEAGVKSAATLASAVISTVPVMAYGQQRHGMTSSRRLLGEVTLIPPPRQAAADAGAAGDVSPADLTGLTLRLAALCVATGASGPAIALAAPLLPTSRTVSALLGQQAAAQTLQAALGVNVVSAPAHPRSGGLGSGLSPLSGGATLDPQHIVFSLHVIARAYYRAGQFTDAAVVLAQALPHMPLFVVAMRRRDASLTPGAGQATSESRSGPGLRLGTSHSTDSREVPDGHTRPRGDGHSRSTSHGLVEQSLPRHGRSVSSAFAGFGVESATIAAASASASGEGERSGAGARPATDSVSPAALTIALTSALVSSPDAHGVLRMLRPADADAVVSALSPAGQRSIGITPGMQPEPRSMLQALCDAYGAHTAVNPPALRLALLWARVQLQSGHLLVALACTYFLEAQLTTCVSLQATAAADDEYASPQENGGSSSTKGWLMQARYLRARVLHEVVRSPSRVHWPLRPRPLSAGAAGAAAPETPQPQTIPTVYDALQASVAAYQAVASLAASLGDTYTSAKASCRTAEV